MADLVKFKSIDGLSESQFNAQPGRINAILVLAEGTNKAGQVGTDENVGRIEITRNGQPIVNRSFNHFVDMNDIRAGKSLYDSTDGAAFLASAFIPFFEKGHPNALNITGEDELNVRFIPADDGTVFADLDITFEQQMVSLSERYLYKILGNDINPAAALNADGFNLNQNNVSALYLEDIDDVITNLSFESNERNVVTTNGYDALRAYTNYNNRIENDTFDIVEIENHTPGVPGSTVNRNNRLIFTTSGAGSIDVTVCSMHWNGKNGR